MPSDAQDRKPPCDERDIAVGEPALELAASEAVIVDHAPGRIGDSELKEVPGQVNRNGSRIHDGILLLKTDPHEHQWPYWREKGGAIHPIFKWQLSASRKLTLMSNVTSGIFSRPNFMDNYFESPFKGKQLSEHVRNPNIKVGRYSYYSGYYHGHSFDDCARYLLPDSDNVDKLIIGSFCSIGTGASFIMAGNQGHRYDWASSFPFFYMKEEPAFSNAHDAFQRAGDTVIGSDVWIGAEAMIMPGIKVGHGAVIGSRALVTKDVEPYAIVGGNPAIEIKKRFPNEEISLLLDMEWWNWPIEEIEVAMPFLCSSNIVGLHNHWRSLAT